LIKIIREGLGGELKLVLPWYIIRNDGFFSVHLCFRVVATLPLSKRTFSEKIQVRILCFVIHLVFL
jgi:hypothetical protein